MMFENDDLNSVKWRRSTPEDPADQKGSRPPRGAAVASGYHSSSRPKNTQYRRGAKQPRQLHKRLQAVNEHSDSDSAIIAEELITPRITEVV